MKEHHYKGGLYISAAVLSMATFGVVIQSVDGEPFISFRSIDAFVQIGVAMALMVLWAQFFVGMVYGFMRRLISFRWWPFSIWVFFCEAILYASTTEYVQDITRYVVEAR